MLLGRGRGRDRRRRPRRGRADHRRARAERRRLPRRPARLLAGPARAGRQVRRAADGRRGHLRLRAPGRVDRDGPRGDRARLGVLGQGADVGLRGDGRRGRRRVGGRADRRAAARSSATASPSAAIRSAAAIALKNMEIFERDGVLENVRALTPYLAETLRTLTDLPIVGDVRGDGFFWAMELVKDDDNSHLRPGRARHSCCAATCPAACARRGSSRAPTTAATRSCRSRRR